MKTEALKFTPTAGLPALSNLCGLNVPQKVDPTAKRNWNADCGCRLLS